MAIKMKGKQNKVELGRLLNKRFEIQAQAKKLDAELKQINAQLSQYVLDNGIKDAKGSQNFRYENFALQHQARTQIVVNAEAAVELLGQRKILKKYSKAVVTREDVERALADGAITRAEAKSILEKKISYAFVVNEIKEEEDGDDE